MDTDENHGLPPIAADDPRVLWAAERTLLAWIRTGLSMMGFGFLVARFGLFLRELAVVKGHELEQRHGLSLWIGTALVVLGVAVTLLAALQHAGLLKQIFPHEPTPLWRSGLAMFVALSLVVIGLAMAAYLLAVG